MCYNRKNMSCLTNDEVCVYVRDRMLPNGFISSTAFDHPKVSNEIINYNHKEDEPEIKEELHYISLTKFPMIEYEYSKYNASYAIGYDTKYLVYPETIDYHEWEMCQLFD